MTSYPRCQLIPDMCRACVDKPAFVAAARDCFALGFVPYDHDDVVPFGERMAAAPLSMLWS